MEENSILHDHVTAFLHEHMTNSFAYSTTFTSSACKQTKWPPLGSKQSKIVNEYDQEIPQSQTADNPVAP